MLVINTAPIDQSGRTVKLCEYYQKRTKNVTLITYRGLRKIQIDKDIKVYYILNIDTAPLAQAPRVLRPVLLLLARMVKFVYLNMIISLIIVAQSLTQKEIGRRGRHLKVCFRAKERKKVLFVLPPALAIVFPVLTLLVFARSFSADWHRLSSSYAELAVARLAAENICVSKEMCDYLTVHGAKTLLLPDASLFPYAEVTPCTKDEALAIINSRYEEYSVDVPTDVPYFVCSTSYSREEDIPSLLRAAKNISRRHRGPGIAGVLFITTKHSFAPPHSPLFPVIPLYLDSCDYFSLLSACDYGISTHQCLMDYPLKIIDYKNSNLKVIAHHSTPPSDGISLFDSFAHLETCILSLCSPQNRAEQSRAEQGRAEQRGN